MIDLPADQLALVRTLLEKHFPECEVRVFGSRVTGRAKPYSDLDLALVGPVRLDSAKLAALREDFEESTLPIRVDVLDWHAIAPHFQKIVAAHHEVLAYPAK